MKRTTEKLSSIHIFTGLVLLIPLPLHSICSESSSWKDSSLPERSVAYRYIEDVYSFLTKTKQLKMLVMVFCSYLILLLFLTDGTGLRLISHAHVQPFRYKTAVSFPAVFSFRQQVWQPSSRPFPCAARATCTTASLRGCNGCGPALDKVQIEQKPSSL